MSQLRKALSLSQCIFFGVGSILGAGIYTLIGKAAGEAGNLLWLSFTISAAAAALTAFSYAELSAAFPKAGGEYIYASKAFGKITGQILGFVVIMTGIISGATVAIGFAGYFSTLLNVNPILSALSIITFIFIINIAGIKQTSLVNIVFTCIEASGLLFVIYTSASFIGKVDYFEFSDKGFNGLMSGSALVFFAYIGFEKMVKLSEETINPEKNIPRALFIANVIVTVIYSIVAICAVSAIPWQDLAASKSPLSDIVKNKMGVTGATIIAIIALFATSNTILGSMLGSSRVLLNMGKEIKSLSFFATISSKNKIPVPALALVAIIASCFALIGKIETVALLTNLFIFTTFILVNFCTIILRIKHKNLKRPFRIPGSINNIPVISVLGILMTLLLLGYNIYALTR